MCTRPQNVGIKAMEIYFPSQVSCFALSQLEFSHAGVPEPDEQHLIDNDNLVRFSS